MMKKLTALALVFVLMLTTIPAFAWSCPSCGNEMGGKFCTECGTKKPEENICPGCGTNYGETAPKFCSECGTKLGGGTAPAEPTAAPKPLKITKQPENVTVDVGMTAKVTVEAQGEGLTYTWYFKNKGGSSFSKTDSFQGASYSVEMNRERDGRQVYCVVGDKYGNTVQSNTITLSMTPNNDLAPATPVPTGGTAPSKPTATPVVPTATPGSSVGLGGGQSGTGLEIIGVKENADGTVTLSWKNNGKGPYDVEYVYCVHGNIDADKDVAYGYWTDTADVTGTSLDMGYLIPGEDYWLIVRDNTGTEASIYYQKPAAGTSDLNMRITLTPRRNDNGTYTDLERFDPYVLNQDYSEVYGMYFYLKYNKLSADCKKTALFVLTMPDGTPLVLRGGQDNINMYANGVTMWDCFTLDWPFSRCKKWYGEVLEGVYTVDVYIDGEYAASSSFQVGEAKVMAKSKAASNGMAITELIRGDDGSITVKWSDPDNDSPYEIDYCQMLTNDYNADCTSMNTLGLFYDTKEAVGGSHVLNFLEPGQRYWIAVYNANGYYAYCSYEPASVENFPEFTVTMSNNPKLNTSSGESKVTKFSSAEIGSNLAQHGLYLRVDYPQLARARDYSGRVVIEAPNGAYLVVNHSDFHFNSGSAGYVYWGFFDLDWYFDVLETVYDQVPAGEYTMRLYLDKYYAASTTFTVGN